MEQLFEKAASAIKKSKKLIALTGAGHSVDSGIPDFRSPGGLWEQFDPAEYANISAFHSNPRKVWDMVFALRKITDNARPNAAHLALARLEELGLLKSVITQNIDNLHQEAGNEKVIEFHGNASSFECLKCRRSYSNKDIALGSEPPVCPKCESILKPGFIFFGEAIPRGALSESDRLAGKADVILVIATSAVVQPASLIPYRVKDRGGLVIEMNLEETGLTRSVTDIFLQGRISETLPKLVEMVEN
ncbi:MAG: NAD-dependent deacylase [bacterium]|nr:NAD-dependent deacylase [bacterium]